MNESLRNIRSLPGAEVLEHINCAYVARRFFNRSRSWFIHRLNNNIVNGKPVSFTDAELRTLRSALVTLSDEIKNYSSNIPSQYRSLEQSDNSLFVAKDDI